jgi:PiT family inorganic phosphate transporter
LGSGLGKAGGVVHWKVVRNMVIAWLLTLPAAGLMGALAHEGVTVFPSDTSGVFFVGIVALLISGCLFWLANRTDAVTAGNVLEPDHDLRPIRTGQAFGAPA